MTTGTIAIGALVAGLILFLFARQLAQRPVTQRGLLAPLALGVALAILFLTNHPQSKTVAAVIIGAAFGVGTGLLSGQLIHVWRDEAAGIVFQRGGWRYLGVIIALLLVRVVVRFLLIWTGGAVDEIALNAGLLAALMGNVVGRDIVVALRALPLLKRGLAPVRSRW